MAVPSLDLTAGGVLFSLSLISSLISGVRSRGGASRGASAGGAAGGASNSVADYGDGGNYTQEEMTVALIVLSVILLIFLCICTCQCYQKYMFEIYYATHPNEAKDPMKRMMNEYNGLKMRGDVNSRRSSDMMLHLDRFGQSPMPCAPYVRDVSNV